MEVVYKLKANEINRDLVDTIEKLFGRNEITITVTGEADEMKQNLGRENPLRPGEFNERMTRM